MHSSPTASLGRLTCLTSVRMRRKRHRHEIDYNDEIPLQRFVPRGFHDTSGEQQSASDPSASFRPMTIREAEGGRGRKDREEEERENATKRHKAAADTGFAAALAAMAAKKYDIASNLLRLHSLT